jgi:hypothetical protein
LNQNAQWSKGRNSTEENDDQDSQKHLPSGDGGPQIADSAFLQQCEPLHTAGHQGKTTACLLKPGMRHLL